MRSRLGKRAERLVLAALSVLVAAVATEAALAGSDSPGAAVTAFVQAEAAADPHGVAATTELVPGAGIRLTDDTALAAMLTRQGRRSPVVRIGAVQSTAVTAVVTAYLPVAAGWRAARFRLVRPEVPGWPGYPGHWRVLLRAVTLRFRLPRAAGQLWVDGLPVDGGPVVTVSVWPGQHHWRVGGSPLFDATGGTLEAGGSALDVASPPRLSGLGTAAAIRALEAALGACAASPLAAPPGCPQALASAAVPVRWQLAAPVQRLAWGLAGDGDLAARGDAQYLAAVAGREHLVAAGFQADLLARTRGFTVGWLGRAPVTPFAAQGAAPGALLGAVAAAFRRCASETALAPPDCPQSVDPLGVATAVRWQLVDGPTSGATSGFDAASGAYLVEGVYAMRVSYAMVGSPGWTWSQVVAGDYVATVLAGARVLRVVALDGTASG